MSKRVIVGACRVLPVVGLILVAGACAGPRVSREGGALVRSPSRVEAGPERSANAARIATRYVGAPYVRGGASLAGFDCSGLVMHVFARVGVSVPHNAAQQYRYGTPVPRERLEPGDLVFFNRLQHNGIYLGEGRFIHASKSGGVKIVKLEDDWFRSRWVGARRL